jgi:N-methylhydantoinase A
VGVADRSGQKNIIAFDMGGTSTDVSISEGVPRYTMEATIDGFPIRVPVLDIHTVGAGGGSIARVDEGGLLRVGPESAGADPGPACYGTGNEPTVTDAHVVLGRIGKQQFLGGTMEIDPGRAQKAVEQIGSRLGISLEEAATGILRVANANMQRAIRVVSVERGHDPRKFALVAFGGCGGLHACEIAEELGVKTVLVPEHAGVLSALGMLMADRVRDYAAAALGRADHDNQFRRLEAQARHDLPGAKLERFTDVRYEGQSYEITIPSGGNFHHAHDKLYGYASPERRVEIVALRVRATEKTRRIEWDPPKAVRGEPELRRIKLESGWVPVNVYERGHASKKPVGGPALFADYGATTYVPPGWTARCDEAGSLVLTSGTRRRVPS